MAVWLLAFSGKVRHGMKMGWGRTRWGQRGQQNSTSQAALPPWVALCPPLGVLWGVWANLVYPVHMGKKQETACQEGHTEFSFTQIQCEDTHVISGRELDLWGIRDLVQGSYRHPNFYKAMDQLFMIILFNTHNFTAGITNKNIMYLVSSDRKSRNLFYQKTWVIVQTLFELDLVIYIWSQSFLTYPFSTEG